MSASVGREQGGETLPDSSLWCADCETSFAPEDVQDRSSPRCPDCGAELTALAPGERPPERVPWHFKVLVFATLGYLVYRLVWLVFWATGHAWHG